VSDNEKMDGGYIEDILVDKKARGLCNTNGLSPM